MGDAATRQLKIKTGIVKRLIKEENAYKQEVKEQEDKIQRLKAEAGDEYVIKKQVEVLQESKMMIRDSHRRLSVAHADLLQLMDQWEDLSELPEYEQARSVLDSVKLDG